MGVQDQEMKEAVFCVPQGAEPDTPGKCWPSCRVFRLKPTLRVEKQTKNNGWHFRGNLRGNLRWHVRPSGRKVADELRDRVRVRRPLR